MAKPFLRTKSLLNLLGPVLALVLLVAIFGAADYWQDGRSTFLTLLNLRKVAVQVAPVLMGALGMTIVIIAGGIDLSVGTLAALSSMTLGLTLLHDYGAAAALGVCVLTGIVGGTLNGSLISYIRMPPFIVTLGTMTIFLGLAKLSNDTYNAVPSGEQVPAWLKIFLSPIPPEGWPLFGPGVWFVLLLAVVVAVVLRFTVAGRYVYALGSNERAAELCGIPTAWVKVAIYSIAGIFFALAGLYIFSRMQQGSPTEGSGFELKVIAAVVVGGASLQGGRGTVLGTCCGSATIFAVSNGSQQLGIGNEMQDILLGIIVISAVAIDQWRLRRAGNV